MDFVETGAEFLERRGEQEAANFVRGYSDGDFPNKCAEVHRGLTKILGDWKLKLLYRCAAHDLNPKMRLWVAENEWCPEELREYLADHDPHPAVRAAAKLVRQA